MIISRIALVNWLCYRGEQVIDLPSGTIAIVGEHDGDQRRSNWTGKTALLESILFALWGWHRKRLADDVITWGETTCSVDLSFDHGPSIHRGRGPGGPFVEVAKSAGKDAESAIDRTIGLSREDAFASCVIRQGDLTRLVDATPGERQSVLAAWLDQELWERCEAVAREAARRADADARSTSAALQHVRGQLTIADPVEQPNARPASDIRAELDDIDRQLSLVHAAREFDAAKATATQFRTSLAKPLPESPSAEQVEVANRDLAAIREEIAGVERKRDWSGKCPLTEQACGIENDVRRSLPLLRDRDAILGRLLERERDAAKLIATLRQREVDAAQAAGSRRAMESQLARLIERGRELKRTIGDIRVGNEQELMDRRRELARSLAESERLAASTAAAREVRAVREAESAKLESLAIERKERADLLWRVAEVFGRNGIQSTEADEALSGLESLANRCLASTGLSVAFATAREGQKLEMACRRCGRAYRGQKDKACPDCNMARERARSSTLDILVSIDGGQRQDVAECSGGCRALVGAALRLAAASLLRSSRGSQFGVLLVDEPFASLDEEHRHLLARRLGEMGRIAGFEQMLVVTHDREIADAMPHRIVVRRESGFSAVEAR